MKTWNGLPSFEWMGYDWISRPLWGDYHPKESLTYYNARANHIDKHGDLVLDILKIPRTFDEGVERQYGVGWVRSTQQFKYGTFEWEAKLPKGYYVWPALWLTSDQGWPPEIDVVEGWTENKSNYTKYLFFNNIRPTMHWSENASENTGKHKFKSIRKPFRCIFNKNGWNKYKCVWTPEYVDIFYNNIKIKRFDDPEMLKHFNKEGYGMHVIMSVSVEYGFKDNYCYEKYKDFEQPMVVRNFKYKPL